MPNGLSHLTNYLIGLLLSFSVVLSLLFLLQSLLMDIWVIYLCFLALPACIGLKEQLAGTNRAILVVDLSENVPATSKSVEAIGQD